MISEWIMWHWRLSNDAENQLCITKMNYILKYIAIENIYFKLYNFSNFKFLL